jgi:uncharacterized protein (TIGR03086 family)
VTTGLAEAVELLERALAYTRGALAGVDEEALHRSTPCAAWTLDQLLDHMGDALDAFTEAASGYVTVRPAEPAGTRVSALQASACALLGAWSAASSGRGPGVVHVGDHTLAPALLVATAALEITVHGWDVGQATGQGPPVPARLARDLLPVAGASVTGADRGTRFGPPRPAAGTSYDARLLAFLGRDLTGPPSPDTTNPGTRRGDTP